jgi:hypothetical protein
MNGCVMDVFPGKSKYREEKSPKVCQQIRGGTRRDCQKDRGRVTECSVPEGRVESLLRSKLYAASVVPKSERIQENS